MKVVALNELIEVYAEKLESDAQVLAKHYVVFHADDVAFVLRIIVSQVLQNLNLDCRLVVEAFLVTNDLECNELTLLVVKHTQSLPETALAEEIDHLIAICDVIFEHNLVVATFVVVSVVVLLQWRALDLLCLRS